MTLEESKIEIQDIIDIYEKEDMYPLLKDRQMSALKVAISALQAQDSPKPKAESVQNVQNEDLISRKAAIDAVENIDCSDGVGISALKCEAVGDVVTAIKALPSAQPVLTCKGCKYDYYEYVQCRNCLRKERDLYEPE